MRLQEQERWNTVLQICNQAYILSPEVEEFTIGAMNALLATGMPKQAIKQYEDYRSMLWAEYNLVPSGMVEELHTMAVELYKDDEVAEEKLIHRLIQLTEESGAFQCGMLVFQNFVQLELRNMSRNKTPACVVILREETLGQSHPSATDIRRIERILRNSLRAGDPFTRLNRGSFALLLPGATAEDSKKIMERIDRDFYSTYPRSRATLQYQIYAMAVE